MEEFQQSSELTRKKQSLECICCSLTSASILMRITFNFLTSSAFATSIPRYPYQIHPLNRYLTKESDIENQQTQSEDAWILACVLAARFVSVVPQEFISISKDRLVFDYFPEILSEIHNEPFISSIIHSLEELCQPTIPGQLKQILGDTINCMIDVIFSCHSLFSAATVPFSPLLLRCIEIESSELEGSTTHHKFADILRYPHTVLQNRLLSQLFSFLTSTRLISGRDEANFLQYLPSLCQSLFDNVSIWGSDYYSPNNQV